MIFKIVEILITTKPMGKMLLLSLKLIIYQKSKLQ